MTKFKGLITFIIGFTVVLIGCGLNAPGYKIYRHDDMLLVFLSMKDTSNIADATSDNLKLNVDIDTGDKIISRSISLKRKLFVELIEPNETLKVLGTKRINGYGVVHLNVSSPIPKKKSMTFYQTVRQRNSVSMKPRPFSNSGAYRNGDRITAYCLLRTRKSSSLKRSNFWFSFNVDNTTTFVDEDTDPNGHSVLTIDIDEPGMLNQSIKFQIKDLKPHETVEIDNKQKLGDDLYLVDLKVVPKKKQAIKVIRMRNRPMNRPPLTDR